MSSDVENITRFNEYITVNNQNEEKEEIEIKLPPKTTSTSNENQKTLTTSNATISQNPIIDGKYLIGKDMNTGDDVYWDTNDLTNYSLLVTGDSGQGKTWTIKRIVTQSTKNDAPCFIINVKGDDFDERFAKEYKFNYLDVDDEGLPFNPLMPIERNGKYRPKRDIDELQSIIMRLVELTPLQASLFHKALYKVYLNCGAPDQARIPKEEFVLNPEPTLELLYETLDNFAESNDNFTSPRDVALLKNKLDIIKNYDIFQVSQIPFEDLINGRWILDISTFADTIKNLILEIFISRIDNYMRTLPGEDRFRSLIVFDEAHRVKDNDQLEEFMRECRAFGFGVIFGTQLPKDLGPDIASHCASQISHRSSDYENRKTAVTAITGESRGQEFNDSLSNLQGFKQGQGYYRTSTRTEGLTYKSVKFLPYKES